MGKTTHEKSFVDFEKPYEQNIIGLRGIVYFAIGLLLLIVVTFGLMWSLLGVLEDNAITTKQSTNPMQATQRERLPPEPRLQAAPGFGVDAPSGRVNLELQAPQSEYRQLRNDWEKLWKEGSVDKGSGAVTGMPIDEAKTKFLSGEIKTQTGRDNEKAIRESQLTITDASSGRVMALRRR